MLECIGVAQELGLGVVKAQELFGMDVADDCPAESNIGRDDVLHSLVGSAVLLATISRLIMSSFVPCKNRENRIFFARKIGKRSKSRGGVILRFTGRRESDSFWECCRSRILTISRTLT